MQLTLLFSIVLRSLVDDVNNLIADPNLHVDLDTVTEILQLVRRAHTHTQMELSFIRTHTRAHTHARAHTHTHLDLQALI